MTTQTNDLSRDLPVRFQLKLYRAGNVPLRTFNTRKVLRVHHVAKSHHWQRAELHVSYSREDASLCNDVLCDTLEELRQAITACTEPELLDYIRGGKWGKE